LINIADIIGYTEKYFETLDWQIIHKRWPLLFNALPLMQYVSPWNRQKVAIEIIEPVKGKKNVDLTSFHGWPHRRLKDFKANGIGWSRIVKDTFLPPVWWAKIYYGERGYRGYLRTILLKHPRQILWWKQLFSSLEQ
jgi:hypothetical protein